MRALHRVTDHPAWSSRACACACSSRSQIATRRAAGLWEAEAGKILAQYARPAYLLITRRSPATFVAVVFFLGAFALALRAPMEVLK